MNALTGDATLEEGLLTTGEEDLSAPAANLRDGFISDTVFYGDATGLFLQIHGRTC